jgi:hypothetical protein
MNLRISLIYKNFRKNCLYHKIRNDSGNYSTDESCPEEKGDLAWSSSITHLSPVLISFVSTRCMSRQHPGQA